MKKTKTLLLIIFVALVFITNVQSLSSSTIDKICLELENQLSIRFDNWRYTTKMTPDAWQPDFDDADWKTLTIGEAIYPDSAWLRKTISIPAKMLGTKVNGGKIILHVSVDDAGICWINGQKKGLFKWTGKYILTENAKPGEKFTIAIKAINTGGPMRLLEAKIEWDRVKQLSEKIQGFVTSLRVGQKLLSDDTYLKTGRIKLDTGIDHSTVPKQRRLELRQKLENAAQLLDLKALTKGDHQKFYESLRRSKEALKPVSEFAREFTLIFDSNAHIDCAWLWRYLETINVAKNTFTSVLDMMDVKPDFTYTQSQAHLYWWMEKLFPDVFKRICARVEDGRWELVGGMWVEPDCNLISGESWARQLLYGKRYFKEKFGIDVTIGWNPDSFGYNWNMPQFYRDSGIKAFITQKIGWNDTNMFPYRLFWWQSPDGTKLLTYFPNSYVNEIKNPYGLVDWLRQFEANTGFKKMLVLYGVGDHGGGPDLQMINRIEKLKELDVYPNVEYGKATDYLNWIRGHDLSNLPVWNDELYLEYHRGTYTTQAKTKKYNRQSEISFAVAEQVSTFANFYGKQYAYQDFLEGWRGILFNQFHDILPGSSIHPVYRDSDELYENSLEIARHEFNESMTFLAKKIDTQVQKNARPILIYNPLPWQRTDVVTLEIPKSSKSFAIYDHQGNEIPSQIVSAGKYKQQLLFVAKNIPSMGYAIYQLKEKNTEGYYSNLKADQHSLENQFFRVTLDPNTGWIKSIINKRNNREYLAGAGNELQLFKDIPSAWDAWNIGIGERYPSTFRNIELIENGPVRAVIRVKHDFLKPGVKKSYPTPNNPNSYFMQDIILYDGINRIDFCTHADWWEEHVMLKVAFEVTAQDSVACFEIPFGTIYRPTTMKNNWEKARFEVSQHKWSDLTDASQDFGISLLNRSKYGGDIHGQVIRLSLLRSPKWPDPIADMGKHKIEYSLYPHSGDWKNAGTMKKGYEYNYPLMAKLVKPHPGKLPKYFSFISLDKPNVILHTVKLREPEKSFSESGSNFKKNVWILRLFEYYGNETEVEVKLPGKIKKAVWSNFMEEDGEPIPVSKDKLKLKLAPKRIVTVKVWL